MAPASIAPLKNILQNTIDNLRLAKAEIEGKVGHHADEGFNLAKFWTDINTAAKKLSFDCTKICICFGKPPVPTPSETSSLLTSVEHAVVALVSVFHKLPLTLGLTLHTHVQYEVVKAIQAVENLLIVIKEEGTEAVCRYSTGVVWEGCQYLENACLDNKSAVLLGMKSQNSMVADAFREISEAMEGDGGGWNCLMDESEEMIDTFEWTDEEKDLVGPSVNLIKAAKILFKRLMAAIEKNGSCNSADMVKELDQLYEECGSISSPVDVLVQDLYPPLPVLSMEEQSHQLANRLHAVLKTCVQSHVIGETEQSHIEFIQKAIDHNLECMREKLSKR